MASFCYLIQYLSMPQSSALGLKLKTLNSEEKTLKNYRESDYALIKYSQGIVYKFADGVVEVTLEDYLRDNPEKTEADFAELKAWSDGIYHEQAVQEQRTCRRNVSIDQVSEVEFAVVPEFDQHLIAEQDDGEKALKAAYKLLHSGILTKVQQRRFVLHYFKGLSTRQIAILEGVRQQTVWESPMWAGKKLRKLFATEKLDS